VMAARALLCSNQGGYQCVLSGCYVVTVAF